MEDIHTVKLVSLPQQQKIKLITVLLESVGNMSDEFEYSVAQKEELDHRLAAFRKDPEAAKPLKAFIADLRTSVCRTTSA